MQNKIEFVPYDVDFLVKSLKWLNEPEIKQLTLTPDFNQEDQKKWFDSLPQKTDYYIWGIRYETEAIGVCGMKNVTEFDAEYWGYIGEKAHWNKGIGTFMLDFIFQEAKNKHLKEVYLKVWKDNQRAIKLYSKYGFEKFKQDQELFYFKKST